MAKLDPLDARHVAEAELGFGDTNLPYEQLVRVAKELRDLRRFRDSYAALQEGFARVRLPR